MTKRPKDEGALQERIGHTFANPSLLEEALTHVSATAGPRSAERNYQRLEFLGDRVLGLAIAEMLNAAFPDAREGELSKRLAELVRRETCADVAASWDVGPFLRLGAGERQSGGAMKAAILGDVAESIIGAVFLDAGYPAASALVARGWGARMAAPARRLADAKTVLQEWAQARGLPPPTYRESAKSGPEHKPSFIVAVELPGYAPCIGAPDTSKKLAAQAAAEAFLYREEVWKRPLAAGAAS